MTDAETRSLLLTIADRIHGSRQIGSAEFAARLGIGRTAFYQRRALGKIGPRPVNPYGHPRWCEAEVTEWMNATDPAGKQYDSVTWPPVWRAMRKLRTA